LAKLHSLEASNSFVWRSFMIARTRVADCSGVRARSLCGRISPSILMAGGKPAVTKQVGGLLLGYTPQKIPASALMA